MVTTVAVCLSGHWRAISLSFRFIQSLGVTTDAGDVREPRRRKYQVSTLVYSFCWGGTSCVLAFEYLSSRTAGADRQQAFSFSSTRHPPAEPQLQRVSEGAQSSLSKMLLFSIVDFFLYRHRLFSEFLWPRVVWEKITGKVPFLKSVSPVRKRLSPSCKGTKGGCAGAGESGSRVSCRR